MAQYIANAFSLQMITAGATITTEAVDPAIISKMVRARKINLKSIVGHKDTARVLTKIMGFPVEYNRESVTLNHADILYVAQITGGRLPEGATDLPNGCGIEFIRVMIQPDRTRINREWMPNSIYGVIERRANELAQEFGGEVEFWRDGWGNLNIDVVGRGINATLFDD